MLVISCASFDSEKILSEGEIPNVIQEYVSIHFLNNAVLQVFKEKSVFKTSYEVDIKRDINLDFNVNKEVASAQGNSQLSHSARSKKRNGLCEAELPQ